MSKTSFRYYLLRLELRIRHLEARLEALQSPFEPTGASIAEPIGGGWRVSHDTSIAAVDSRTIRVYTRIMSHCYCSLMRLATRRVGSVYDRALAPLGINIAQYSLLRTIQRLQPVSLTELGRIAELDRSTVGRNVRVLGRMGLVEMERGVDDHREAVVTLAARGVERLDKAGPLWDECQRKMEMRLGAVKVTALRDILSSI